jgi:uncharacterized membrane protein (UPF0127 family)
MEVLCRLSYSGGVGDDNNVSRPPRTLMVVVALVACSSSAATQPASMHQGTVVFAGRGRLHVRIAETQQERQLGLMNVMALAQDDGMAFVFDDPVTESFWMKDTLIPLSIAFVGDDGRVVSITDMQPCQTDPCPTYAASGPYTLAVEANFGWFADRDIAAGDAARLEPSDG